MSVSPDIVAHDLDEIRGSLTLLAPRRRQEPRLTVYEAWGDLFTGAAMASTASPSTLNPTNNPTNTQIQGSPSLHLPPERLAEGEGISGGAGGSQRDPLLLAWRNLTTREIHLGYCLLLVYMSSFCFFIVYLMLNDAIWIGRGMETKKMLFGSEVIELF